MDFEKDYLDEKEPLDKDYLDEKEPLDVEEEFEKPELTKGTTRDTDPQYFTNINGIYAKDAAGRAAVEELRTLITGYSETVLYSANAPHKNDVELSQAYTNFDEIVIIWKYSDIGALSDYPVRYETTKLTSQMNTNDIIAIWEGNALTNAYAVYDSIHLNFVISDGTPYSYLAKVIGIKY